MRDLMIDEVDNIHGGSPYDAWNVWNEVVTVAGQVSDAVDDAVDYAAGFVEGFVSGAVEAMG